MKNMARQLQSQNSTDIMNGSYETLQFILDEWSLKPLHAAVLLKERELVRVLMVGGIDLEQLDEDGNTALHIACIIENYDMAQILTTQCGAPIIQEYLDKLNNSGQSCLHIAAYLNRWDFINLLVCSGASIDVRDTLTGGTPLHTAVAFHNKLVVNFILHYCRPNLAIQNYAGETANNMAGRILNVRKDELNKVEEATMADLENSLAIGVSRYEYLKKHLNKERSIEKILILAQEIDHVMRYLKMIKAEITMRLKPRRYSF